jgi:hypothetical protein
VFLILVSLAPATVWKVSRSAAGVIHHLEKTRQFVNHYSFYSQRPRRLDPLLGHQLDDDPKPFVWHKTADEILNSLASYCPRVSDSGH